MKLVKILKKVRRYSFLDDRAHIHIRLSKITKGLPKNEESEVGKMVEAIKSVYMVQTWWLRFC